MYVPAHFAMSAEQVAALLPALCAGDLISNGPQGLSATYLPLLFEPNEGDRGTFWGHLSRVNDQWRRPGEALFLVHGPDAYVEAEWLTVGEQVSVPTWNYVTVQARGELLVHDDPDWTLDAVRRLSAAGDDSSLDAVAPEQLSAMLRAIVGIEVRVHELIGKAKMSQNKPPEVVEQVIAGLNEAGEVASADWMARHSLPQAQAKARLVSGIRAARASGSQRPGADG